ncbi:MAG: 23S rRNA (guanosine(2251)-2'-O)-methyltransferase RlmB [Chloroflexi bacterium]|nr:MAG: 23S rRNA (guanosine(2251)-2'-O)-methyltransferase RlmB [Chloroflexota bacterium]
MPETLYGRNAARETLRARRRHVHRLILAENVKSSPIIDEITGLAKKAGVPVQRAPRREMDQIAPGHQGVALTVGAYPTVDVADILHRAAEKEEPPFIVVLDHIEDPQNLGAILRTAEIAGVHGVILPKQRAAKITPAAVNASAGAAEHMWVAEVANLVQTLKNLKQQNIWVAGMEDLPAATPYHQANLSGALALVVGSEGKGLSRLVQQTCDFLVKLPMRGKINSLNASVAAALVLYEIWRARGFNN